MGLWKESKGIVTSDPSLIKVGSVSDYTEISKTTGEMRFRGDATMWKDMVASLFGKKLNNTAGKVDYDWAENALKFQGGGSITNVVDRVGGNLEINHEFKVGSSITFKPHIHWFQDAATKFELTCQLRLQRNGLAKTTDWTTVTLTANDGDDVWVYDSGSLNQITRFPDLTVTCGISDTIQFRIARTDSLGGDMRVYFLDMHGQVDSAGSNEEITKEA